MKRQLPFLMLILIVSCKQKEIQKAESIEVKPTMELKAVPKKQIEEIVIPEQYFENDSLLTELESDLEKIALNPKFDIKVEPNSNTHDESVTDTIKTLTFDKTKIYSYRATNWESIYSAKIENSDFEFLDSIFVGIKKEKLENRIKTEFKTDLLKIGNLEQTSVFIFKFENGKLKFIEYQGYVD
ncbi:hypothetical protein [Winogradskyella helgolandensis]|uniref:hypothetical protein n=1 Tax=Winogradskyella helgolandensis TaxID=2697010 RepID=UPI0015BCC5E9|nr:hypothetical protein [Winogradskyella helgolandensis]